MTQFPNDDDKLIAFLRQHRPVPPPEQENLEAKIMAWVAQNPHPIPQKSSSGRKRLLWILPSAIAASVLITWSGSRLVVPSLKYGQEQQELETFMVSTWDNVMGESSIVAPLDSPETVWLSVFEE